MRCHKCGKQKLLRNPQRSLSDLKKIEKHLTEEIDDLTYFGGNPSTIQRLENELLSIKKEISISTAGVTEIFEQELPEAAIQQQIFIMQRDIESLKSLEEAAKSYGDYHKAAEHSATKLDLETEIIKIRKRIKNIIELRHSLSLANDKYSASKTLLASLVEEKENLGSSFNKTGQSKDPMAKITSLNNQIRDTVLLSQEQQQNLWELEQQLNTEINSIVERLTNIGYQPTLYIPPAIKRGGDAGNMSRPMPELEAPSSGITLPSEISEVYEQVSDDPITASLQKKLKSAVEELAIAMDGFEPRPVIKKLEAKIAKLHEEIEKRT